MAAGSDPSVDSAAPNGVEASRDDHAAAAASRAAPSANAPMASTQAAWTQQGAAAGSADGGGQVIGEAPLNGGGLAAHLSLTPA